MILKIFILTIVINLFSKSITVEAAIKKDELPPILASTLTPFSKNNSVNVNMIPRYAKYLKENGINGVTVTGTIGEGCSLNLKERMELIKAWTEAEDIKVIVVVGAGLTSMDNYKLVEYSQEHNVEAIMFKPYTCNRPRTAKNAVQDMKDIAMHAPDTPILYYDNPEETGVQLDMVEFYTLATARIPTFIGVSCSLETGLNITSYTSIKDYQYIIIEGYQTVEATFRLNFNITLTAMANVFPELVVEIEESSGTKRAEKAQDRLNSLYKDLVPSRDYLIPTLKEIFYKLTCMNFGGTRPPRRQLTDEMKKNITRKLEKWGIKTAECF